MVNLRGWAAFLYLLTSVESVDLAVNLLAFLTEPQSWLYTDLFIVVYFLNPPMLYDFELHLNQAKDFKNFTP
jgi:hypothetical protein